MAIYKQIFWRYVIVIKESLEGRFLKEILLMDTMPESLKEYCCRIPTGVQKIQIDAPASRGCLNLHFIH